MLYINESGLYSLILSSKLESARRFKHWVTSEVLPSIRKQGGYMVARADEPDEVILARALQIMHTAMERREKEIAQNEGAENESFRKTQKYLSRFENS